ncbi:MAG: hypothetical protein JF599_03425 [Verrucomicrobia bacterium]|nr:hypothetical protein [Verrucomicrobiota bacterium]
MQLSHRWLYVVWIAVTVLWHQAGGLPGLRSGTTIRLQSAQVDAMPMVNDFTFQAGDNLEDKACGKRLPGKTFLFDQVAEPALPSTLLSKTADGVPVQGISAARIARRLIRGPPVNG